MKRDIDKQLDEWLVKKNRKPLIIIGARQIGKTYSVKSFAKRNFLNKTIYINFFVDLELKSLLTNKSNAEEIINIIQLYFKVVIDNSWIIIFDEIQEIPSLKISLKDFFENRQDQTIISLGSYLGNSKITKNSFPVGSIETIEMFPLSFKEYLIADNNIQYVNLIDGMLKSKTPYSDEIHEIIKIKFNEFLMVGGMPSVVNNFLKHKNYQLVNEEKRNLINDYKQDILKYIESNSDKFKAIALYERIPEFLINENNKVKLSKIETNARYINYSNAIESLWMTNMIVMVKRLKKLETPLVMSIDDSNFKIYYNDVGFLTSELNQTIESLNNLESSKLRGSIAENYVISEFAKLMQKKFLNYYSFTSQGRRYELDLVIENNQGKIVPVEIKYGINFKTKSLNELKKTTDTWSIIFSNKNFSIDENSKKMFLPLYSASFLKIIDSRIEF